MKFGTFGGFIFFILYATVIDQTLNSLDIPYKSYITVGVGKLPGQEYVQPAVQAIMTVALIAFSVVLVKATPKLF